MSDGDRTLLAHLAQWHGFSSQGEVLSTQGLSYLLEHASLNGAVTQLIVSRAGIDLPEPREWLPEVRQEDDRRPDLEGRDGSRRPVVKVEAKIRARLTAEQLRSYSEDQRRRLGGQAGVVVVLVPESRVVEAGGIVRAAYNEPETLSDQQRVIVLSWEEVLDECHQAARGFLADDVRQLRALVTSLVGPARSALEALDETFEGNRDHWRHVVDRATRELTQAKPVYPFGIEWTGYERRYVWPDLQSATLYSIGICKSLDDRISTPIWLRFHAETPGFDEVLDRLCRSYGQSQIVRSEGHIWIGLVPSDLGAPPDCAAEEIVEQARSIEAVALP